MPFKLDIDSRRMLALVGAAFLTRVVFVLIYGIGAPVIDWGDDHVYNGIAEQLVSGGGYDSFWSPPGYPLFLAAIYASFGPALYVVRLLQAVAGALTCGLTMRIGTHLFGARVGVLSGLLLAIFPGQLYMTWRIMPETLFTLLVATSVLLALRFARRPDPKTAAWLGLALGLSNLLKSNLILFPPLLFLWIFYRLYRDRRNRLVTIVPALALFSIVSLVTPIANYVALDGRIALFAGNAGKTLWWSNNPMAEGYFNVLDPVEQARIVERYGMTEAFEIDVEPDKDRLYRDLAIRWVVDHPRQFGALCVKKLMNAYGPTGHSAVFERFPPAKVVYVVTYGCLLPFIAGGLLSSIRRRRAQSILFLLLGSFTFMTLLFYGTPRFTLVVMPYLMIWAGLGANAVYGISERPVGILRTGTLRVAGLMTLAACLLTALTYMILFGDEETIDFFAGREKLLESLGALLFLISSAVFLATYVRLRRKPNAPTRRRFACLALCFLFFAAFGEEISWGQRIIGFSTPDAMRVQNRQAEFNVHNLGFLDSHEVSGEKKTGLKALVTSNRLFDYFMITLFMIVPAARKWTPKSAAWMVRLGIPVVPSVLLLPLVANLVLTGLSEVWLVDSQFMHLAVSEIREFNYAFLCAAMAVCLFLQEQPTRSRDSSEVQPQEMRRLQLW